MKEDRKWALEVALQKAVRDTQTEAEELVDFDNMGAVRDWYKFGSITALADQLEQGRIVDPEVLVVAAEALRKLSEKTERAALGRRAIYWRDYDMHVEAGYYYRPEPGTTVSERVEKVAVRYGFTDVRGVYKAISKFMAHLTDNRSKY